MVKIIKIMRLVAVGITLSIAFAGCEKPVPQNASVASPAVPAQSVNLLPAGAKPVEFKVIHSDISEEEADRELVRKWIADEMGLQLSEVEWKHSKEKFASFETAPKFVEMWRAYNKTDAEIQAMMDDINRSRIIDFKPAGRAIMSFTSRDGKVKPAKTPDQVN